MSHEYRREYLISLPMPLAQLYSRANNARDAFGRFANSIYAFEAVVKLGASIAAASSSKSRCCP